MLNQLKPYAFSGATYSKIGGPVEPLMSAESVLRPSLISPYSGSAGSDRQHFLFGSNPADSMLAASSHPQPASIRSQSSSGSSAYSGQNELSFDPSGTSGAGYETFGSQAQVFYPTSAFPPNAFSTSQAGGSTPASEQQLYYSYLPKGFKQHTSKHTQVSTSSQPGETGTGHYSGFYAAQPSADLATTSSNNHYESHLAGGQYQGGSFYEQQPNGIRFYAKDNNEQSTGDHENPSAASELLSAGSLDSPTAVLAQQHQFQLAPSSKQLSYSNQPSATSPQAGYTLASPSSSSSSYSSLPSSGSRRSGPVSLKMDESTRAQFYDKLQKHFSQQLQQAPSSVIELNSVQFSAPKLASGVSLSGGNLKYPSASSSPLSSPIVPITAADAQPNSAYVVTAPIKSSRVESSSSTMNSDASAVSFAKHQRQQQGQSKQQLNNEPQAVAYKFIRPKTGANNRASSAAKPDLSGLPEDKLLVQNLNEQTSNSGSGPWRSVSENSAGSSWTSPNTATKQTTNNKSEQDKTNEQEQEQQQQQQQQQTLDNQLNPNVAQEQVVALHRVSRTPNQSSVKTVAPTSAPSNADYESAASENLSDKLSSNGYSNNFSKGLRSASLVDPSAPNSSGTNDKSARKHSNDNKARTTEQAVDSTNLEDNTADDDSKTTSNLIQLSADNVESDTANNSNSNSTNNNVKLIEASTSTSSAEPEQQQADSSPDRLADTGLVIMLPTARNSHLTDSMERRPTSMRSTGESSEPAGQKHRHKLQPETVVVAEEGGKSPASLGSPSQSSDTEMLPDTPFGYLSAGYLMGGH